MKIMITGISGFVGQNLEKYLNKESFTVLPLSLRGKQWRNSVSDDYNVIIHLAGKAHDVKNTSDEKEYFEVNYELTKELYDIFLQSNAKKFIFVSSVKAAKDIVEGVLVETDSAVPTTAYGKSKKQAEDYILNNLPTDKEVYILRPCMIHGPGNKGNLNLLYNFAKKSPLYPLASYKNQRSFLSIDNFCFVIENLLNSKVENGIYQLADDDTVSTNEIMSMISTVLQKKIIQLHIPKVLIGSIARVGGILHLPLNNNKLQKLTENYIVSNKKIVSAINKSLPLSARDGLIKTLKSFNQ